MKLNHHPTFVCAHCIHPFTNQQAFEKHFTDCSKQIPQKIEYPKEYEAQLFWKARAKTELYGHL